MVSYPDEYFMRPAVQAEKFPGERPIQLPPELAVRIEAQNAAGRLVFEGGATPPPVETAAEADVETTGKRTDSSVTASAASTASNH